MSTDCTRVLESLGSPLAPELAAHAAHCPECQPLVEGFDVLAALGPPEPLPPTPSGLESARTRALQELVAHPRATPWTAGAWKLGALYTSLVALGVAVFAGTHRLSNAAPLPVVVGLSVVLLVAMGLGVWVALAPARHLGFKRLGASTLGVSLLVLLGGSGLITQSFLPGCVTCVRTGLLLSLLPFAAGMGLLRRIAFHAVRAVAVGLAAGAVGLLLLHVHCPEGSTEHLAAAHVGPWLALGALAPWVRSRLRTTQHTP